MFLELILSLILLAVGYEYYVKYKFRKVRAVVPTTLKQLPLLGNIQWALDKRNVVDKIHELHQIHGPRFLARYGPIFIMGTMDPEDVHTVVRETLEKPYNFYKMLQPVMGFNSPLMAPVPQWKRLRHIAQLSMTQLAINLHFDRINRISSDFMDELQSTELTMNNSCFTNIQSYFFYYAVKSFCSIFMDYGHVQLRECIQMHSSINRLWIMSYDWMQKPWLYLMPLRCVNWWPEFHHHSAYYFKFIDTMIASKWKETSLTTDSTTQTTFFATLYAAVAEQQLSMAELRDQVSTNFAGATDTIATTLSFATVVLALRQDEEARILQEIHDVIGADPINFGHLSQLKYLECFINEVLRLFPPLPQVARYVRAELKLHDGLVLPAGTYVGISILSMLRNEEIWPQALHFQPERFYRLDEQQKRAFLPFSDGKRNCSGRVYAQVQMKIVLVNLLRRYRCVTSLRSLDDIQVKGHVFLTAENGFPVKLVARQH